MRIHLHTAASQESLGELILRAAADDMVQSLMILACDADNHRPEDLRTMLQACPKPLFGGIFPQIVHGLARLEQGTLVVGLQSSAQVSVVSHLSDVATSFDSQILDGFGDLDPTGKSLFVFVDGLSKRISDLIEALFNNLGLLPNYIGGGAGSLSFQQKPCLFTNQGIVQDAAVLALVDTVGAVGVAHGWTPVSDAVKVTQADRNTVISLNWRPAFEVYREIVEAHSGRRFADESFFELAKSYPLGIAKLDAEMVVRDPIIQDDGRLICVGEVPEGGHVHILSGDVESLIRGASTAKQRAEGAFPGDWSAADMIFVDCISRVLFLEKHFERELAAVECGLPLVGALTLGEIANMGDAYLEFYNKTSVVGVFDDRHDG